MKNIKNIHPVASGLLLKPEGLEVRSLLAASASDNKSYMDSLFDALGHSWTVVSEGTSTCWEQPVRCGAALIYAGIGVSGSHNDMQGYEDAIKPVAKAPVVVPVAPADADKPVVPVAGDGVPAAGLVAPAPAAGDGVAPVVPADAHKPVAPAVGGGDAPVPGDGDGLPVAGGAHKIPGKKGGLAGKIKPGPGYEAGGADELLAAPAEIDYAKAIPALKGTLNKLSGELAAKNPDLDPASVVVGEVPGETNEDLFNRLTASVEALQGQLGKLRVAADGVEGKIEVSVEGEAVSVDQNPHVEDFLKHHFELQGINNGVLSEEMIKNIYFTPDEHGGVSKIYQWDTTDIIPGTEYEVVKLDATGDFIPKINQKISNYKQFRGENGLQSVLNLMSGRNLFVKATYKAGQNGYVKFDLYLADQCLETLLSCEATDQRFKTYLAIVDRDLAKEVFQKQTESVIQKNQEQHNLEEGQQLIYSQWKPSSVISNLVQFSELLPKNEDGLNFHMELETLLKKQEAINWLKTTTQGVDDNKTSIFDKSSLFDKVNNLKLNALKEVFVKDVIIHQDYGEGKVKKVLNPKNAERFFYDTIEFFIDSLRGGKEVKQVANAFSSLVNDVFDSFKGKNSIETVYLARLSLIINALISNNNEKVSGKEIFSLLYIQNPNKSKTRHESDGKNFKNQNTVFSLAQFSEKELLTWRDFIKKVKALDNENNLNALISESYDVFIDSALKCVELKAKAADAPLLSTKISIGVELPKISYPFIGSLICSDTEPWSSGNSKLSGKENIARTLESIFNSQKYFTDTGELRDEFQDSMEIKQGIRKNNVYAIKKAVKAAVLPVPAAGGLPLMPPPAAGGPPLMPPPLPAGGLAVPAEKIFYKNADAVNGILDKFSHVINNMSTTWSVLNNDQFSLRQRMNTLYAALTSIVEHYEEEIVISEYDFKEQQIQLGKKVLNFIQGLENKDLLAQIKPKVMNELKILEDTIQNDVIKIESEIGDANDPNTLMPEKKFDLVINALIAGVIPVSAAQPTGGTHQGVSQSWGEWMGEQALEYGLWGVASMVHTQAIKPALGWGIQLTGVPGLIAKVPVVGTVINAFIPDADQYNGQTNVGFGLQVLTNPVTAKNAFDRAWDGPAKDLQEAYDSRGVWGVASELVGNGVTPFETVGRLYGEMMALGFFAPYVITPAVSIVSTVLGETVSNTMLGQIALLGAAAAARTAVIYYGASYAGDAGGYAGSWVDAGFMGAVNTVAGLPEMIGSSSVNETAPSTIQPLDLSHIQRLQDQGMLARAV